MAAMAGLQVENPGDIRALTTALGQSGQHITAYARIKPGRGEYQNFGILQAMDHLAVIGHLIERGAAFDRSQIFACGASHGGYIAHMIAKIAPGLLAGISENSGYTQPPISYLGLGTRSEYQGGYNGVVLMCHVDGAWSYSHRRDRNFYDRNRDLIRDVAYPSHLRIMADRTADSAMAVCMVNCAADEVTPPDDKQRQAERLRAIGVPTELQIVQREDIDGVLFREYAHALALSHKRLFVRDLERLRAASARGSGQMTGSVEYPCVDVGYRFSVTPEAPYVTGEVYELF
jgi:hypothetical protein